MGVSSNLDLKRLNARFERASAEEILTWAWATFAPEIAASSSFQTQSVPLLHLISRVCPAMPIIFVDTGFHFPETLAFRDRLRALYDLNVVVVHPSVSKAELLRTYGEVLYRRDPDLCCHINKVMPMREAMVGRRAWISGVRRDQTDTRQAMRILEQRDDLLRVHPLLSWTGDDVAAYRAAHDLPAHPLQQEGYRSIGCAPCTRPVFIAEDSRAGRWADSEKRECGLHLDWNEARDHYEG